VLALEDLSGRTFHDNAALWKEWWDATGPKLRSAWEDLGSADEGALERALPVVASEAWLAGARRLLRQEGLGPAAPAADAAAPRKEPAERGEQRRATIARALSGMPKALRDRSVAALLLAPFAKEEDLARRERLIGILGGV